MHVPGSEGHVGVTSRDHRLFVVAVQYRYQAGIPWRDLHARFGEFRVVHLRHLRWSKTGVRERIFKTLSQDAGNEYVMIDSTIVPDHQHSSGAKGGSGKASYRAQPRRLEPEGPHHGRGAGQSGGQYGPWPTRAG